MYKNRISYYIESVVLLNSYETEIKSWLNRLNAQAHKNWLLTVARNYFSKDFDLLTKVDMLRKNDASITEAQKKAFQFDDLYIFDLNKPRYVKDLDLIVAFFNTNPHFKDISRISYYEMVKKAENYFIKLKGNEAGRDYEVLTELPDGFKVVNIISHDGLIFEGIKMQHCTRDDVAGFYRRIKNKTGYIWSLRDEFNNPHVTMEVTREKAIVQIKGKQNKPPLKQYNVLIQEFIKVNKIKVKREIANIGMVNVGNTTYSLEDVLDSEALQIKMVLENPFNIHMIPNPSYKVQQAYEFAHKRI